MKKIYFDFETTGRNPVKADIIEATFIFVENKKIVKTFHSKIKLYTPWKKIKKWEKEGLKFNNINNSKDLEEHNEKARDLSKFLHDVKVFALEFSVKPIPLSGWNSAGYDMIILKRYINVSNYFAYHQRDIMQKFQLLREIGKISSLKLSEVHQKLIGTIKPDEFHNSEVDCIATKDLDEWFEEYVGGKLK